MFHRFVKLWFREEALTLLFVLLVLELFLAPILHDVRAFRAVNSLVFGLLILAGLFTFSYWKPFRYFSVAFVAVAAGIRWTNSEFLLPGLFGPDLAVTLSALVVLIAIVLRHVYRRGPVTWHKVIGGVSVYLLTAMAFAYIYCLVQLAIPNAFNFPSDLSSAARDKAQAFYYFSVVTLTTVGYGDLTAVHPVARSFVMAEALIGQLFPVILIAHLVSLHLIERTGGNNSDKERPFQP